MEKIVQINGFQNPLPSQLLDNQKMQSRLNAGVDSSATFTAGADSENLNNKAVQGDLDLNAPNKIDLEKVADSEIVEQNFDDVDLKPPRITYGLKVLELMSDDEYRAFLRASADLSVSEKMQMAQGLYRFTDFYAGRKEIDSALDAQTQEKLRNYGVQNDQIQAFLNRYKNAYAQIMQMQM